jgi:hypothetical protein
MFYEFPHLIGLLAINSGIKSPREPERKPTRTASGNELLEIRNLLDLIDLLDLFNPLENLLHLLENWLRKNL